MIDDRFGCAHCGFVRCMCVCGFDDEDWSLEACWFCGGRWGACSCDWSTDPEDGFDAGDTIITEPNVSECGRFFVNPHAYYGMTTADIDRLRAAAAKYPLTRAMLEV